MKRLGTLIAAILSTTVLLVSAEEPAPSSTAQSDTGQPSLPVRDIELFVEAYHKIRERFVMPTSDKQLMEFAIKGILQNLDPHSDFLSKEDFSNLRNSTSGEFAGLGVEVMPYKEFIKVISAMEDTPAERAGLKSGDLIVKIDDLALKGIQVDNVLDLLHGKKGSIVRLLIVRDKQDPFEVSIKRETIRIRSVKSELLARDFGYIRINQFQQKTARDFKKHTGQLTKTNRAPLKGLIIDLRNNPGGLLHSAISLSDYFLDSGVITYTRGRDKQSEEFFHASPGQLFPNLPLVVLVNGGSASSSEILAGALQDHERAIIVGTRTFGKGSVQSIIPVSESRAIKLTTARYYTPNGRSIQALGIEPDIRITAAKVTPLEEEPVLREAHLLGHLGRKDTTDPDPVASTENLKTQDFQLYEAFNILKTLNLAQKHPSAGVVGAISQ